MAHDSDTESDQTPSEASDFYDMEPKGPNLPTFDLLAGFRIPSQEELLAQEQAVQQQLHHNPTGLGVNIPWGWNGSAFNDYDVITVHGIRDSYKDAWIEKGGGSWWVRRKLFADSSVRELNYSYDIGDDSVLYGTDGIRRLARDLIVRYSFVHAQLPETEVDRPVIWVCHDLGGTIVKEALHLATNNPARYGRIPILTSAIFLFDVPHVTFSRGELENQILQLVQFPGPRIETDVIRRVKRLADQIEKANRRFLATRLLERAAIFHLFNDQQHAGHSQDETKDETKDETPDETEDDSREEGETADDQQHKSITTKHQDSRASVTDTPISPFCYHTRQPRFPFESAGLVSTKALKFELLVHGDPQDYYLSQLSALVNAPGFPLAVDYRAINLLARFLSLAPPTRIINPNGVKVSWEQMSSARDWLEEQSAVSNFLDPEGSRRPIHLHLHGNGSPFIHISDVSRYFFMDLEPRLVDGDPNGKIDPKHRVPLKSILYFEFDRHDSRYSSLASMLIYFINLLMWHSGRDAESFVLEELLYLENHRCCSSFEDLYDTFAILISQIRFNRNLTLFISCFDQCPERERKWFFERALEDQNHIENNFRLIVSTSTREGLGSFASLPSLQCINLGDCPIFDYEKSCELARGEMRDSLNDLLGSRPIYDEFLPHLETLLLERCAEAPYLRKILLDWFQKGFRGMPREKIETRVKELLALPLITAAGLVQVFIGSLTPGPGRSRAENVFNLVKHAAEPWSPEALAQVLVLYEHSAQGLTRLDLDDVDVEDTISIIKQDLSGILGITAEGDVKFSHPSFYLVPTLGSNQDTRAGEEEKSARLHAKLAETCLRYFFLQETQTRLAAQFSPERYFNREGFATEEWKKTVDTVVFCHARINMAEYAIRFWPEHYKKSGRFKPRQLVRDFFANLDARRAWQTPFWLLSNSFTRINRTYVSTLPIFAMLGLEDLVKEELACRNARTWSETDCWFAITEAARTGNEALMEQLLLHAMTRRPEARELDTALFWAAASGNAKITDQLIQTIPDVQSFEWPKNLLHRAAVAGLDGLVSVMVSSGVNINEHTTYRPWAPPLVLLAFRNRAKELERFLSLNPRPSLEHMDKIGRLPLTTAILRGNPDAVKTLLEAGASLETVGPGTVTGKEVSLAVFWGSHMVLETLISYGKAAFISPGNTERTSGWIKKPLLVGCAMFGHPQCTSILLRHGSDPNLAYSEGHALAQAVRGGHPEVARHLLEAMSKTDLEELPGGLSLLCIDAVHSRNNRLLELLVNQGLTIDPDDPVVATTTPLIQACALGNLDMVKTLVEKGRCDINLAVGEANPPLHTAIESGHTDVARYLLQRDDIDVVCLGRNGMGTLHLASNLPDIIPDLLKAGAPYYTSHDPEANGSPLHWAASRNQAESMKMLLSVGNLQADNVDCEYLYGYNPEDSDDSEQTSMPANIGFTPLHLACATGAFKCVEYLLDAGANPHFRNRFTEQDAIDILLRGGPDPKDAERCLRLLLGRRSARSRSTLKSVLDYRDADTGQTRLHHMTWLTPYAVVRRLIDRHRVAFDDVDEKGYTPLAVAISVDNRDVVSLLIQRGANVNVTSPAFGSLLHMAVTRANGWLIKELVKAGADVEVVAPPGGPENNEDSLLSRAMSIRDSDVRLRDMVRLLVEKMGVPVDIYGGTEFHYPLVRAADMARDGSQTGLDLVRFFISKGADLNVPDNQGRRAVHLACASRSTTGHQALVELVRAGARTDIRDRCGRLPLHFAAGVCLPNDQEVDDVACAWCFNFLMDHPLPGTKNLNVADYDGWTPLMYAARSGVEIVVQRLVDEGADVWLRVGKWSPLKLATFWHGNGRERLRGMLTPLSPERIREDNGQLETWVEDWHKSKRGAENDDYPNCKSCFVAIVGKLWECMTCEDEYSLCFKCANYRSELHNSEHRFDELGTMYDESDDEEETEDDMKME